MQPKVPLSAAVRSLTDSVQEPVSEGQPAFVSNMQTPHCEWWMGVGGLCVHMCLGKVVISIHALFNSKEFTHFFKRGKVKASGNKSCKSSWM